MSKVGKFLYLTQDIPRDTKPPYRTAKLWVSSSLSYVCYFEHKKEPDKQLRKNQCGLMWKRDFGALQSYLHEKANPQINIWYK